MIKLGVGGLGRTGMKMNEDVDVCVDHRRGTMLPEHGIHARCTTSV